MNAIKPAIKRDILIIEDDPEQLSAYQEMLSELDYQVHAASEKQSAIDILKNSTIDILVTDMHLTNSIERDSFEGFELLAYANTNNPECLLIAMSNDPKPSTYYKALELGALNFIKKPVLSAEEFRLAIITANERKDYERLKEKVEVAATQQAQQCSFAKDGLVLDEETRESASLLAQAIDLPCIIQGETGTGKEEIAKLIHRKRVEREGPIPFIAVNCANLDSATAASHLFGHKKGSFTGADSTTIGYVGEANGGILFLDEIHTLAIDNQRRLLRVLNDGTYQRFGDTKTLRAEFQVIVATCRNLDELVQQGTFIPDLRSRITGILINLKPLRERREELNQLVPFIFDKLRAKIDPTEMGPIIDRCKEFYWQDNIRQLYNVLRTSVSICQCRKKPFKVVDLQVFPAMLAPKAAAGVPTSKTGEAAEASTDIREELFAPLSTDAPFDESVERYERIILQNALERYPKIQDAAAALKLPRSTFDAKRKKYGL